MRALTAALVLAGGVAAATGPASAQDSLTVVSWGGGYAQAQTVGFYEPFTRATGTRIRSEDWNGNLGQIRAQVDARNVTWDVVIGDSAYAKKGCEEGFLERVEVPAVRAAEADFLPGSIQDCGVASVVWGYVVGYDKRRSDAAEPTTIADFFDLRRFPGKRGFPRRPESTLEFALMADGVPASEVYRVLSTREGVDRAFHKLDTIKGQIVWWEAGAQPAQLLNDGEVTMTISYASRLIQPIVESNKPFGILWDGHLYDLDTWVVPRGSPHRQQALDFIRFASEPGPMAAVATRTGNAPARASALPLVGNNPTSGADMKPYLLTNPEHRRNAVQIDSDFWADRLDDLKERFNAWLAR